jgi:hypothetical protein
MISAESSTPVSGDAMMTENKVVDEAVAAWVVPVAVAAGVCCLILLVGGGFLVYKLGQRNAARVPPASTEMVTARADEESESARSISDYASVNLNSNSNYGHVSVPSDAGYGVLPSTPGGSSAGDYSASASSIAAERSSTDYSSMPTKQ